MWCVPVFCFGSLTIGLSFTASYFTPKLIQAAGTVWGVLGCPLGGVFIMGFFLPFCNSAVNRIVYLTVRTTAG